MKLSMGEQMPNTMSARLAAAWQKASNKGYKHSPSPIKSFCFPSLNVGGTTEEAAVERFALLLARAFCYPGVKIFVCDDLLVRRLSRNSQQLFRSTLFEGFDDLGKISFLSGTRRFLVHHDPRENTLYFLADIRNQRLLQRIKKRMPEKPQAAQTLAQEANARLASAWETVSLSARTVAPISGSETTVEFTALTDHPIAINGTQLFLDPLDQACSFVVSKGKKVVGYAEIGQNKVWLYPAGVLLLSKKDVLGLCLYLSQNIFCCAPSSITNTDDKKAIEVDFSEPPGFFLPLNH